MCHLCPSYQTRLMFECHLWAIILNPAQWTIQEAFVLPCFLAPVGKCWVNTCGRAQRGETLGPAQ